MTSILSIAIPVYNMEKHLDRCLSSVLYDGCPPDVEIIIINDGSKDNSKNIIDTYAQLYPSQVVAIHKENGGWGSCINHAIQKATGKYFRILDSDDEFNRMGYENHVACLRTSEADLHVCSYREVYPDSHKVYSFNSGECEKAIEFNQYLVRADVTRKLFPLAAICYRTEIIRTLSLAPRYYADLEYDLLPLASVQSVVMENNEVYQYYRTYDEQSTSVRGYILHKYDYLLQCKRLVNFYVSKHLELDSRLDEYINNRVKHCLLALYTFYLSRVYKSTRDDERELRKFDNWLKISERKMWKSLNLSGCRYFIPYVWIWRVFNINLKGK